MHVGGTEGQIVRLASGLVRRGIDLHVVTAVPGDYDSALVGETHRIAPFFKQDPLPLMRLIAIARRLQPDVMQTFLTQMDIVGGIAASTLRIPWILSERSTSNAYPPMLRYSVRAFVGRRADRVVANSTGGADYWRSVGRRDDDIRVIPNIIPRSEIESAVAVEDGSLGDVILCVGRLSAEKNLQVVLEALAPVFQGRDATAVFAGDGYLRPVLEQKARDLGIENRTRFLGNVTNVWSWMKRATVVVAASTFEGNPNAVLEAAAAGTPLLLSDIPGHRAVLNDEEAAYVDGSSPQSIRQGIEQVLANRAQAALRAARATKAIGSRSEDDIAAQYEQVYREVIMEKRK